MADLQVLKPRLPDTYQEVEYIETSGTQYINTGKKYGIGISVYCKFAVTAVSNYGYIFGEQNPNANFGLRLISNTYELQILHGQQVVSTGITVTPNVVNECTVAGTMANPEWTINGNQVSVSTATFGTAPQNTFLCAGTINGTGAVYLGKNRIYEYRVALNGTTIQQLIPCYRKSDNVIGFYDLAAGENDKKFYTNGGTGVFAKGADKSVSGTWQHSLRKQCTATETIQSGDTIYADGTAATVSLKGNTVQNGTPTPTTPIMPQGTGVRTGNLFDESYTGIMQNVITYKPLNVGDGDYTLSSTVTVEGQAAVLFLLAGNVSSGATTANNGVWNGRSRTVTAVNGYVTIGYRKYPTVNPENFDTMLNTGSTAKPYEPYGYKIPISSTGQTTPIYLGEVQSTRKIKKLVLTGQETWYINNVSSTENTIYVYTTKVTDGISANSICTHYQFNGDSLHYDSECFQIIPGYGALRFRTLRTIANDVTEWKTYLQQQYSAGTPVTVWYILANETTGIVNEPLMKIGSYSDSLSTTIPCTAGENTLDVQTTVQPSETTVNYKGWHPVQSVHERENGQWD